MSIWCGMLVEGSKLDIKIHKKHHRQRKKPMYERTSREEPMYKSSSTTEWNTCLPEQEWAILWSLLIYPENLQGGIWFRNTAVLMPGHRLGENTNTMPPLYSMISMCASVVSRNLTFWDFVATTLNMLFQSFRGHLLYEFEYVPKTIINQNVETHSTKPLGTVF